MSSVFSSLAAYCMFPVKPGLFPQFIMTDFCIELSLALCISVSSLSLPNSHQPGWYLAKSPCYSTIFLFIASHSCPLWFLLLTCLPSLLLISLHSPSFPHIPLPAASETIYLSARSVGARLSGFNVLFWCAVGGGCNFSREQACGDAFCSLRSCIDSWSPI